MIIRRGDAETEAGVMPSEELIAAMGKYNEEMVKAGVLTEASGLQPSSKGARVTFAGGKPTVIDGPFTESKELIAGYSIIQVKSKAEAIEWVKRWPVEDAHGAANIEIRQLYEMEDFGPSPAIDRMIEVGLAEKQ
jgi:hypothetical protein